MISGRNIKEILKGLISYEQVSGNKRGVKPGTARTPINKDGSKWKSPGVPKGTKRCPFNKDGSPRKKPGPKPKKNVPVGQQDNYSAIIQDSGTS